MLYLILNFDYLVIDCGSSEGKSQAEKSKMEHYVNYFNRSAAPPAYMTFTGDIINKCYFTDCLNVCAVR